MLIPMVVEETGKGERAYDIYSKLLKADCFNRSVAAFDVEPYMDKGGYRRKCGDGDGKLFFAHINIVVYPSELILAHLIIQKVIDYGNYYSLQKDRLFKIKFKDFYNEMKHLLAENEGVLLCIRQIHKVLFFHATGSNESDDAVANDAEILECEVRRKLRAGIF